MKKQIVSRLHGRKGNELIEFALVLPLLILMLAGAIEFGRAFYTYNILTKSVRNAARYVSAAQLLVSGTTGVLDSVYVNNAKNLVVYGNVAGTGIRVIPSLQTSHITVSGTATPGTSPGQYYLTVGATYPYSPLFGFVLSSVNFRPSVTMLFVGVLTYPPS